MQRLMEELRRHAADYERATDPAEKRRALRRFRVAFLLGNQSLGLPDSAGDPGERLGGGIVPYRAGDGAAGESATDGTRPGSAQETETWSRTTTHSDSGAATDGGSAHSVGRSGSAGICPHCTRRAGDVEWRSTTRTIGIGHHDGESITEHRGVCAAPGPRGRRENGTGADGEDRDDAAG
jgi:hypothetical protein